jgi:hypothetical protein
VLFRLCYWPTKNTAKTITKSFIAFIFHVENLKNMSTCGRWSVRICCPPSLAHTQHNKLQTGNFIPIQAMAYVYRVAKPLGMNERWNFALYATFRRRYFSRIPYMGFYRKEQWQRMLYLYVHTKPTRENSVFAKYFFPYIVRTCHYDSINLECILS